MTKLTKTFAALAALAAIGTALPASAADARGFSIYNGNGSIAVERVWTAPINRPGQAQTPWTEANMNGPIYARSNATFDLPYGNECYYDLKVRFSDGFEQTFNNINVCRYDAVTAS